MLTRTRFGIDSSHLPVLARHSLESFDHLMTGDLGTQVARKRQHEVRRIELALDDGGSLVCYLRRSSGNSFSSVIKALARCRLPRAACMREYLMIRHLERFDLPVMKPIAWGQRSRWGLPRESLLLVEAVPGRSAMEVLAASDSKLVGRLLQAAASLAGRLNRAGFFQPLRLRDVMCTGTAADGRNGFDLVLIDRETNLARRRRLTTGRCCDFLARSYCKLLQAGFQPDVPQALRLLVAYRKALAVAGSPPARQLLAQVVRRVRRLTAAGAKYDGLGRDSSDSNEQ